MKNPLITRLPRELKGEVAKYLVIFLFMTVTIGFISGFLVADNSAKSAYENSFVKYNIEDGNFELKEEADTELIKRIEADAEVSIYQNYYVDLESTDSNTIRIYEDRKQVNLVCIMEGKLPEETDDIALDRLYAKNNNLKIGDKVLIGQSELSICGIVALSDYSALFSDNSDMMFDSIKFGVAVVNDNGFEQLATSQVHYVYSFHYKNVPDNKQEEKSKSDDLATYLSQNTALTGYIPTFDNQAIQFTGDDMGSDKSMMLILLYILIVIIGFVFAVTISNTVSKEASVIGTLRALGYTRGELIRHYIGLPIFVSVIASIIGNILGYTLFRQLVAGMYYNSYSLTIYITLWNAEAFILTTAVPLVIMLVINLLVLWRRMKLSPLRFLRHDLGNNKKKKVMNLPPFRFFSRFRIRIIQQNLPTYLTMFIGVLFANILLLFGLMMTPLLHNYQDEIIDKIASKYQYILQNQAETKNTDAEKYGVTSLNILAKNGDTQESVSVYGLSSDSEYIDLNIDKEGAYISDGFAEKYSLSVGDTVELQDKFNTDTYKFYIVGTYDYPAGLTVFMKLDDFNNIFDYKKDYYNGYFSNEELTDIDDTYVASVITIDDLTKLTRQMDVSMGEMFVMVNVFAVILFMLLLYLLSKLIIEKNASYISMVKILGYNNKEISRLYLMSTTLVVVLSILASIPLSLLVMKQLYSVMMFKFSGWITFYISPTILIEMFVIGLVTYSVIAMRQFVKIKKVPMDEVLKNME